MTKIPPFFHIETTNKCNLKCDMCGNRVMQRKPENISIDLVSEAIAQIKRWNKKPTVLFHTVGEPTLHPQINDIINLFLFESIPIHFYTNGTITNVKLFSDILKYKDNNLTFSLGRFESDEFVLRLESVQKILSNLNMDSFLGKIQLRVITEQSKYENKKLVRLSNIIEETKIQLEITFEGNQGGYNPRKPKKDERSYSRVCSLPFNTLVINNKGFLAACRTFLLFSAA